MDHPGLARVFDAGATPTGRPYFVMELVRGVPLDAYCDQHRLDVAQRALGPQLAISPRLLRYRLRLPDRLPRVALLNIMSLLPGTLSAALEGDDLLVHVLDGEGDTLAELQALEQQVARLSGVTLTGDHKGERNEAI